MCNAGKGGRRGVRFVECYVPVLPDAGEEEANWVEGKEAFVAEDVMVVWRRKGKGEA